MREGEAVSFHNFHYNVDSKVCQTGKLFHLGKKGKVYEDAIQVLVDKREISNLQYGNEQKIYLH